MQHCLAPDPLPDRWAPVICDGFLALSSALAQSQTQKTGTHFSPSAPILKSARFSYLQQRL